MTLPSIPSHTEGKRVPSPAGEGQGGGYKIDDWPQTLYDWVHSLILKLEGYL